MTLVKPKRKCYSGGFGTSLLRYQRMRCPKKLNKLTQRWRRGIKNSWLREKLILRDKTMKLLIKQIMNRSRRYPGQVPPAPAPAWRPAAQGLRGGSDTPELAPFFFVYKKNLL